LTKILKYAIFHVGSATEKGVLFVKQNLELKMRKWGIFCKRLSVSLFKTAIWLGIIAVLIRGLDGF
jgi:hypothetical protein